MKEDSHVLLHLKTGLLLPVNNTNNPHIYHYITQKRNGLSDANRTTTGSPGFEILFQLLDKGQPDVWEEKRRHVVFLSCYNPVSSPQ